MLPMWAAMKQDAEMAQHMRDIIFEPLFDLDAALTGRVSEATR
jgi:hypothetical protein